MKNDWIFNLDDNEIAFIKQFILSSGSLKSMADYYDSSYHIIRSNLNQLIEKVKLMEVDEDSYVKFIKSLALQDKYDYETTKKLIDKYNERSIVMKNDWIFNLDDNEIAFIKQFILSSGSLKSMADYYDSSYHIIRSNLNQLIEKVKLMEVDEDSYVKFIKSLALQDKYDYETTKKLIDKYNERRQANE